ncbi:hypothetical protein WR25_13318 [Diploscapter pachys]|uniref:Large ribosomal subunit protein bL21m n=1 Tax=Diploscapter pachys TaxID=2018661 RepID=A0A2A2LC28_9BILA|nr:hypothetical protein WR25_13318 [Diploscapter pachys]
MNRLFIRPLMFCRRFATNPEVINPNAQQEVAATVSSEVSQPKNRLFAVVYVGGKQWKVTQDDLIVIFGNNPLKVGDEIKLEKVLMLSGKNFSLFGRPFLDRAKVHVDAVVVEKAPKYPELLHYSNQHYLIRIERWLSDMSTTLRVTKVRADDDVFQANTQ